MYDCSAKQHIPFLTLLAQRKIAQIRCVPTSLTRFVPSLLPTPVFPRLRPTISSLCTTPIPVVWQDRPLQSRISPTVPRLSVTGRHCGCPRYHRTAERYSCCPRSADEAAHACAFFADGLQVISVVQNTEKRCELMLLQAESSGLHDVVPKCMPAHGFRLFLRTKRVSIC